MINQWAQHNVSTLTRGDYTSLENAYEPDRMFAFNSRTNAHAGEWMEKANILEINTIQMAPWLPATTMQTCCITLLGLCKRATGSLCVCVCVYTPKRNHCFNLSRQRARGREGWRLHFTESHFSGEFMVCFPVTQSTYQQDNLASRETSTARIAARMLRSINPPPTHSLLHILIPPLLRCEKL